MQRRFPVDRNFRAAGEIDVVGLRACRMNIIVAPSGLSICAAMVFDRIVEVMGSHALRSKCRSTRKPKHGNENKHDGRSMHEAIHEFAFCVVSATYRRAVNCSDVSESLGDQADGSTLSNCVALKP